MQNHFIVKAASGAHIVYQQGLKKYAFSPAGCLIDRQKGTISDTMEMPQRITELLESEKRCVLATSHRNKPHLSLMLFTRPAGSKMVILSSRDETTKVKNIKNNPEVALLLYKTGAGGGGPLSCTLHGTAEILDRAEDHHFREAHYSKHESMGNFILGENISIIAVKIKHAVMADIKGGVQTWSLEEKTDSEDIF